MDGGENEMKMGGKGGKGKRRQKNSLVSSSAGNVNKEGNYTVNIKVTEFVTFDTDHKSFPEVIFSLKPNCYTFMNCSHAPEAQTSWSKERSVRLPSSKIPRLQRNGKKKVQKYG